MLGIQIVQTWAKTTGKRRVFALQAANARYGMDDPQEL
jgi:hypothetical protein